MLNYKEEAVDDLSFEQVVVWLQCLHFHLHLHAIAQKKFQWGRHLICWLIWNDQIEPTRVDSSPTAEFYPRPNSFLVYIVFQIHSRENTSSQVTATPPES